MIDAKKCRGCRNDFYNHQGGMDGKGCWSRADAEIVTRYRQGWWDQPPPWGPDRAKVQVPTCYRQSGTAAYYKEAK